MNRKFKVWDDKNKEWNDWDKFYLSQAGLLMIESNMIPDFDYADGKFIPVFSTGFRNENGVEIFDGDILSYTRPSLMGGEFDDHELIALISYGKERGGWIFSGRGFVPNQLLGTYFHLHMIRIKIIGNKFEHPHLLEEVE